MSIVTGELSALGWAAIGISLTVLFVVIREFGIAVLETATSWFLGAFNPGVLPRSKPVSGPKWRFPNGLVIQRFTDGRASSAKWREYGSVYRLWSGPHPEIVITTPKDFKHFGSDANDHGKPHNMNFGWYVGQVLGQCLGFQNGQEWVRMRKIFDPTFTHSAAVTRIETVDSAARKYVERLPRLATSTSDKSFTLSLGEAFTKFPYFLTASTIYGPMTEAEEDDLWRITQIRSALSLYLFSGGPYRFATASWLFDRGAVRRLRDFERQWEDFNARIVQTRRARGENPPIIGYWEQYEGGIMTLPELLQTLDELLIFNLDVITHVITWCITLIADHDHVKQELIDEVATNQHDLLQYLTKSDTHLHRCFAESMRIRPFTIFTPGEYSNEVKNFNGVLVKPGTQILLDVLAINVRNPFWGTNSETFNPSRLKNIKSSDLRYNLHSFGIGSRKCMGQYVASHIVKALVLHLFREYNVVLADGAQAGGSYDVDKSGWTPKAGGYLQLTKR
ncbi:cytochrome P450 monooxygenase GliC2 [Lophiotrema nucula]|uniref:Cytochrome P450 monooxygenase GliC2 n=1 Tax=Lophiotrema nucula TaxID=690887 RepID=A0A6A5ZTN0_9PLEO|nr:cytochrome P450 monooxygenase GliC2 [Lophiotrema nucula]